MSKVTLVCYRFTDGLRAYFLKGKPRNHVLVRPNEAWTPDFPIDALWDYEMKIAYSTWCKRLKLSPRFQTEKSIPSFFG